MNKVNASSLWLILLWSALTFGSLAVRPLMPVDETRYASVAWEMWVNHDFLVPHLNGEIYSHKPPLLFWLINLSWWLFGVNDWSLRLISPLFALATLFLTRSVAKLIWPQNESIAQTAPFFLLGSGGWIVFSTLTMFDVMLTFFALLGIYSVLKLARNDWDWRVWLVLGVAIGGGVFSKGPVILLHILPVALLAPWWLKFEFVYVSWQQWYSRIVLAVLIGAIIALTWAIPAGIAGGQAYRNAIFLGQTSGRIVDSFAHKLPMWWYLKIIPLFLLPWLLTKPFWLAVTKLNLQDFGVRFCTAWLLPVFIAFSLISGKRVHYLIPLLPGVALLLAYAANGLTELNWRKANLSCFALLLVIGIGLIFLPLLAEHFHWKEEVANLSPMWGVAVALVAAIAALVPVRTMLQSTQLATTTLVMVALVVASGFFSILGHRYDVTPPAQKIAEILDKKLPLTMYAEKYHGQFQFVGRLKQAIPLVSDYSQLLTQAKNQPDDLFVVMFEKLTNEQLELFQYRYPLKGQNIGFIKGEKLLENPNLRRAFLR